MLRYRGLLFTVCSHYARRGLTVDDLLQESMLSLWNHRTKLFSISPAPMQAAWIWRVARNTCIDHQRHTPPPQLLSNDYDPPIEDSSLHDTLQELIELLPEPDHTIVTMHLEGYEYKEIGQHIGMTKNNVGIRLMRIKDKLKEQWNIQE